MKTDQELEQMLRATFAGRARTVTRGPAWRGGPAAEPAEQHGPHRRWLAALTAAAAVAAIVAGVAAVRDRDTNGTPATTNTPTPPPSTSASGTSAPSTSASSTDTRPVVVPPTTTCATALPQAWQTALRNSVVDSGSPTPATANTQLLAVSGDDLIVLRDDSPVWGSGREVVQLRPGHSPKTLYTVPNPDTYNAETASVSGKWLIVALWRQARPPKNTIGGNTPTDIAAIIAVDMTTGHSHAIATSADYLAPSPTGAGLTILDEAVLDGKVYWNERASYAATTGTVKSYDLDTDAVATVETNVDGQGYLVAETEGLVISPQGAHTLLVPATLPAIVASATTPFGRAHLNSDGGSYGWAVDPTTIGFWRPGMSAPAFAEIPGGFDTDDGGGTPAVAGDYVVTLQTGGAALLTNMITRASAPLTTSDFPNGAGQLYYGSNGAFAGYSGSGISSHYVDGYWLDSPSDAIRLDTTSLPKLAC